jgi:hypothetical protein
VLCLHLLLLPVNVLRLRSLLTEEGLPAPVSRWSAVTTFFGSIPGPTAPGQNQSIAQLFCRPAPSLDSMNGSSHAWRRFSQRPEETVPGRVRAPLPFNRQQARQKSRDMCICSSPLLAGCCHHCLGMRRGKRHAMVPHRIEAASRENKNRRMGERRGVPRG